MHHLDESKIMAMAPNAAAAANGRKLAAASFTQLKKSTDETVYFGECKGSGKSNYIVSGDFLDPDQPIFRCSCPSRQFPCKHSLGLMFCMISGKAFSEADIPADILEKRSKKEAREAKKEENAAKSTKAKAPSKASLNARRKKIEKQLEGLELLKKMISSLLSTGLAAVSGASLSEYRKVNKQLAGYYLPGPQAIFEQLLFALEDLQGKSEKQSQLQKFAQAEEAGTETDIFEEALDCIKRLRFLTKKSEDYLQQKLENDAPNPDDNILYEELGGIWRLDELNALGLKKENAELFQLSFDVLYDEAKKEYTDKAYWLDLSDGSISYTANYRPLKAVKYINQEDNCFSVVYPEVLSFYPGTLNKRIRWESAKQEDADASVFARLKSFAHSSIAEAVKIAKNELKNTLSDKTAAILLSFAQIKSRVEGTNESLVLCDASGASLLLGSSDGSLMQIHAIKQLPYSELLQNQVVFGFAYYDRSKQMICFDPRSIITDEGIIRLRY